MRKGIRVVVLSLLGLLSTAVLGAVTALMAAVSLAATALIVPGTGTPNANIVDDYMENFRDYYMQDTVCGNNGCPDDSLNGVNYPASFWPIPLPGWCDPGRCEKFDDSVDAGVEELKDALANIETLDPDFDGQVVIAGYSQGARVVTIAKTKIINGDWNDLLENVDEVQFVFIGNPNRPNGGILSRFGILGHIPILDVTTGQPTPTGPVPGFTTEDWAIRWEGIADFPQYLLNPLAVANSLLGFYYDHGTYLAVNEDSDPGELPAGYSEEEWELITSHPELYPDLVNIQTYGDTTYYTVTPKVLPLVRPLHSLPFLGKPIADLIEPALRVIIEETGYNRDIPFGQPTEIGLIPLFNPITLFVKLIPAVFQGINNFLANFGLATEIPLSPSPVAPPSPLQDQQEQEDVQVLAQSGDDPEGFSAVKLKLVQGTDEAEQQQPAGVDDQKTFVANTETETDLTLVEGTETLGTEGTLSTEGTLESEGTIESEESQESGLEQSPTGNVEVVENNTNAGEGDDIVPGKAPEDDKGSGGNTINANGGSVSLNFSPNKPADNSTGDVKGADEPDPTANPEPDEKPESPEGPQGPADSESPADSEKPAA
ncbi:hypothetical protein A5765_09525 [Mycolicibacterium celeriflavum]|uniref:PE-PPE domain-containing protein n=1 Tax=Mycolicibacterium celeriflavum TaxID=1249101 RepID=UPI0007FE3544|nr:PE-PPE domain-containing protein [Mycolicibacterium celeriflavum]OBG15072.1 hypothetical protein A5765_09525 [Mycolicibacterium celeriflavum]